MFFLDYFNPVIDLFLNPTNVSKCSQSYCLQERTPNVSAPPLALQCSLSVVWANNNVLGSGLHHP